jgi:uncharacterized protein YcfJ
LLIPPSTYTAPVTWRDDGTTGLIVGGISRAVLGHIIAPGGSKTLGTIIGAGAGALIGRAIDDGDIVCR